MTLFSRRPRVRLPLPLIDLAAGRQPECVELTDELVAVAKDHRMAGLLWTWAQCHAPDSEPRTALAVWDLKVQAHLVRVWDTLESSVQQLGRIGIDIATMKGVIAEQRWYGRGGERQCADVDLLLGPHQLDRAADAVAVLQPDHPWRNHIAELVRSGRVQTVTLQTGPVAVDLHFDLLKLGIPTRRADDIWEATVPYELCTGGTVRVLDATTALLNFLVHLNKDRFQRLLGYADIARVIDSGGVDWVRFFRLARDEGIETSVLCALETVLATLRLPWPNDLPSPHGLRAAAWRWLWRPGIRLRGQEGRLRFRARQQWLAVLARGRGREAVAWWLRELCPSSALVDAHYQHIRGPYLWKLVRGRVESAQQRQRDIAELRR